MQATPTSAAFGRITTADADKGVERKITIVNNADEPLKLSEPKSSNPKFKATIAPIEDGKKFELTVTVVPPLVNGNNTGNIEVETGVKELPKLTVPVYAFITASVDVTPTSLNLPPSRTAPLTRQFYVRSNVDKPIKITNLACTNPEIKLDLADVKDAKTFRLTVNVPADYKPAPAGDKITFNTDDPGVPLVTLPISEIAPVRPVPTAARPVPGAQNRPTPGARPVPVPKQGVNDIRRINRGPQAPGATPAAQKPAEVRKVEEGNTAGAKTQESDSTKKPAG